MTKIFTTIILCFFFFGLNAQQICLIDSLTKKKIDSTYLALMKENKVSGMSIAIVDNGQIVYATGYGFSDVEAQTPATSKSIYRIGSITKSFTALSVMQLQQQGKLSVKDDLKQHIPEFAIGFQKNQVQPIYLRNIMAHTAGLPSDLMNGFFTENPPSFAWTIEQSSKVKMSYPLAYSHSYSNFGYEILGEIVARKGEMDYEKYIQRQIFSPLGMNASFVYPNEVNNTPKSYLGKKLIDEPLIRDAAAGLIHSNVEDMSNYLMMYLNRGKLNGQQILDSLSIVEMEKKQTEDLKLKENSNFGYGLYSNSYYFKTEEDSSIVTIIGHGGDTYTFHADMKYIPELGVGVVLLTSVRL
ncbi:MAG: serine hydrolase domain-containing protein [Fluviicola sp.]